MRARLSYFGTARGLEMNVATVLLEPKLLVRDGLQALLAGTRFDVVATGSTMEDLRCSLPEDRPILFVIAPGDDVVSSVGQVREAYPLAMMVEIGRAHV